MKITFTYGSVEIILNQRKDGFYSYAVPKNIQKDLWFFSVEEAINFFSNFLPKEVYDADKNSLSFVVEVEYKNKKIKFYMSDYFRTKISWTGYDLDNKAFNHYVARNKDKKKTYTIDRAIKLFTEWVDSNQDVEIKMSDGKTYLIQYDQEEDFYYCGTPFARITGKTREEVESLMRIAYTVVNDNYI